MREEGRGAEGWLLGQGTSLIHSNVSINQRTLSNRENVDNLFTIWIWREKLQKKKHKNQKLEKDLQELIFLHWREKITRFDFC